LSRQKLPATVARLPVSTRAMRLTAAVNSCSVGITRTGRRAPNAHAGLLLRQGSLALMLQIGNNPVQRAMS
jgi:hypothetical protein